MARPKTCKGCGDKFTPARPLQVACSIPCAITHTQAAKSRKEAKAIRDAKAATKPRSKWLSEAQAAINKWIRLRDADRPCISCGRHHTGKYDAGHYRSVGSNPALRFEPLNIHKQCVPCNQHKSGNAVEYRIGLIARIGQDSVDWLEGKHEPKHYSVDDLKAIKKHYTHKAKELANGTN